MPDTDSITIVKEFTYRGLAEEWSNTYHLDGTTPSGDTEWRALAAAIWASERTLLPSAHKLVKAYGYNAGNENSAAQVDFRVTPPTNPTGGLTVNSQMIVTPGDSAFWIRARVGLSSKGKKVYVRKYFHGAMAQAGAPDTVAPEQKTPALAHAQKMLDGSLPGGMKWVGPQGATPVEPSVGPYITTRTLKRRGKRPS